MSDLEDALMEMARLAGQEAGRAAAKEVCARLIEGIDGQRRGFAAQLTTIAQMAEECSAFSRGALEKLVQRAHKNGLERFGAVIRRNGRVFIHRQRFDKWLQS